MPNRPLSHWPGNPQEGPATSGRLDVTHSLSLVGTVEGQERTEGAGDGGEQGGHPSPAEPGPWPGSRVDRVKDVRAGVRAQEHRGGHRDVPEDTQVPTGHLQGADHRGNGEGEVTCPQQEPQKGWEQGPRPPPGGQPPVPEGTWGGCQAAPALGVALASPAPGPAGCCVDLPLAWPALPPPAGGFCAGPSKSR